jgi:biopolymer transport protein ExbD
MIRPTDPADTPLLLQLAESTGVFKPIEIQALREVLDDYKKGALADRADIEVAAEDDVVYQDVISAMDTAIGAQFRDIGFIDPQSLTVRFKE